MTRGAAGLTIITSNGRYAAHQDGDFMRGVSATQACSAIPSRLVSRRDAVGEVSIQSQAGGVGPPVVLVHGYAVSGRYLLPLARLLAARYATYVPDLLPYGRRGRASVGASIQDLADALGDWIDVVGLSGPALVANSMGCQIVTELAVRRPHRVGPLVLTAPTIEPAKRSARHQIIGALRDSRHEPAGLVTLAVRDRARRGVIGLHTLARSALADRIEERLPHVHQQTVVVHGGKDRFISREWAQEVAGLLPHGRLLVVPDATHAVPYTHPSLVAEALEQLITRSTVDHSGTLE
ncbi:MAG TPA: alpha/beta hydrolase [Gaiellales bacterium]|nr:alpha/beta hydrolase [Gaiellales bacterium]